MSDTATSWLRAAPEFHAVKRVVPVMLSLLALSAPAACRSGTTNPGRDPRAPAEGLVPGQVPAAPSVYASMPTAGSPGALGVAMPLGIGAIVNGTLQAGDTPRAEGGVADDYVLNLSVGLPVTIVARGGPSTSSPGSMLDMYIYLYFNGVEVARDDDSASNGSALNSRIVYTPSQSGSYTLRVTTFGRSTNYGSYTIQTYPGALYTQM